jgi:hypothetical protein
MAVFAPMPRASVKTTTAVNPGDFLKTCTAKRASWPIVSKPAQARLSRATRVDPSVALRCE